MSDLTDDDLSELAEVLIDACEEAIARGMRISDEREDDCCCPIGALRGANLSSGLCARFPVLVALPRLSVSQTSAIYAGFEGFPRDEEPDRYPKLYDLGRSLRERYMGAE